MLWLQSCAFLRVPLEVGWLSDRLTGDLLEIQKACFLHWSNGFLMILSLQELQGGVKMIHFALFYRSFLIFEKK